MFVTFATFFCFHIWHVKDPCLHKISTLELFTYCLASFLTSYEYFLTSKREVTSQRKILFYTLIFVKQLKTTHGKSQLSFGNVLPFFWPFAIIAMLRQIWYDKTGCILWTPSESLSPSPRISHSVPEYFLMENYTSQITPRSISKQFWGQWITSQSLSQFPCCLVQKLVMILFLAIYHYIYMCSLRYFEQCRCWLIGLILGKKWCDTQNFASPP